jgi:hypothetical protein
MVYASFLDGGCYIQTVFLFLPGKSFFRKLFPDEIRDILMFIIWEVNFNYNCLSGASRSSYVEPENYRINTSSNDAVKLSVIFYLCKKLLLIAISPGNLEK